MQQFWVLMSHSKRYDGNYSNHIHCYSIASEYNFYKQDCQYLVTNTYEMDIYYNLHNRPRLETGKENPSGWSVYLRCHSAKL